MSTHVNRLIGALQLRAYAALVIAGMEGVMEGNLTSLTYAACGILIVAYGWGRFNTPPSNRSSTRRALYWYSCAGYILTGLIFFAVLSALLQVAAWRTALLGKADNPSLPAPLIATLA